ncbi:hypothetical protein JZU51_02790, partial [bacterium]|nr:hypothetical protein [bacterium]
GGTFFMTIFGTLSHDHRQLVKSNILQKSTGLRALTYASAYIIYALAFKLRLRRGLRSVAPLSEVCIFFSDEPFFCAQSQ